MRIAFLITCFNRRNITLRFLESLSKQVAVDDLDIEVFLVDDGSSDGTSEAVERAYPQVHLLKGDGSLYWGRGMCMAFEHAIASDFDAYILANDDVVLYPDALNRLIATYRRCLMELGPTIVVGSVQDPETGQHTYGGQTRHGHGLRLDFLPVIPSPDQILACDTMHMNLTLVPAEVARQLDKLDSTFTQKFTDLDYGLRATKQGIPIRIAPGYFGTCDLNYDAAVWRAPSLSLARRWQLMMSPKGLPPREWLHYTKRHFGWRWPFYALSPYLKVLIGR